MDNEIATIEKNNTWELTKLPKGMTTFKWIYKTKLSKDTSKKLTLTIKKCDRVDKVYSRRQEIIIYLESIRGN